MQDANCTHTTMDIIRSKMADNVWSEETVLQLLADFIDSQDLCDVLLGYFEDIEEAEQQMTSEYDHLDPQQHRDIFEMAIHLHILHADGGEEFVENDPRDLAKADLDGLSTDELLEVYPNEKDWRKFLTFDPLTGEPWDQQQEENEDKEDSNPFDIEFVKDVRGNR